MFEAALGMEARACPHCGKDPSIFGESLAQLQQHPSIPAHRPTPAEEAPGRKRSFRKHRRNVLVVKLLAGWVIVMALLVLGVRQLGDDGGATDGVSTFAAPGAYAEAETLLLQKALPSCVRNFQAFLAAGTPEARNQYVRDPIATAGKMARFYAMNPMPSVNPAEIRLLSRKVLKLGTTDAIGTTWSVTDGRKLDAVFVEEEGEWRLDWYHFVRYGDYPWPLFVSGSGGDSGEFRLLARQRTSTGDTHSGPLSLTLYAPRFGLPGEPGVGSPEIEVSRTSSEGLLLMAAFQEAAKGEKAFDGQLSKDDPDEMIRVRVKVRRNVDDRGNRHFTVEKVIACHWLSWDEAGVVPLTPEEALQAKPAAKQAQVPERAD
ncbi:hypothetical protein llg_08750 [Luteolibacter sp. LG18]|nr:hypothetical protein llg_08750 [Luteolibacter sp. LG18]